MSEPKSQADLYKEFTRYENIELNRAANILAEENIPLSLEELKKMHRSLTVVGDPSGNRLATYGFSDEDYQNYIDSLTALTNDIYISKEEKKEDASLLEQFVEIKYNEANRPLYDPTQYDQDYWSVVSKRNMRKAEKIAENKLLQGKISPGEQGDVQAREYYALMQYSIMNASDETLITRADKKSRDEVGSFVYDYVIRNRTEEQQARDEEIRREFEKWAMGELAAGRYIVPPPDMDRLLTNQEIRNIPATYGVQRYKEMQMVYEKEIDRRMNLPVNIGKSRSNIKQDLDYEMSKLDKSEQSQSLLYQVYSETEEYFEDQSETRFETDDYTALMQSIPVQYQDRMYQSLTNDQKNKAKLQEQLNTKKDLMQDVLVWAGNLASDQADFQYIFDQLETSGTEQIDENVVNALNTLQITNYKTFQKAMNGLVDLDVQIMSINTLDAGSKINPELWSGGNYPFELLTPFDEASDEELKKRNRIATDYDLGLFSFLEPLIETEIYDPYHYVLTTTERNIFDEIPEENHKYIYDLRNTVNPYLAHGLGTGTAGKGRFGTHDTELMDLHKGLMISYSREAIGKNWLTDPMVDMLSVAYDSWFGDGSTDYDNLPIDWMMNPTKDADFIGARSERDRLSTELLLVMKKRAVAEKTNDTPNIQRYTREEQNLRSQLHAAQNVVMATYEEGLGIGLQDELSFDGAFQSLYQVIDKNPALGGILSSLSYQASGDGDVLRFAIDSLASAGNYMDINAEAILKEVEEYQKNMAWTKNMQDDAQYIHGMGGKLGSVKKYNPVIKGIANFDDVDFDTEYTKDHPLIQQYLMEHIRNIPNDNKFFGPDADEKLLGSYIKAYPNASYDDLKNFLQQSAIQADRAQDVNRIDDQDAAAISFANFLENEVFQVEDLAKSKAFAGMTRAEIPDSFKGYFGMGPEEETIAEIALRGGIDPITLVEAKNRANYIRDALGLQQLSNDFGKLVVSAGMSATLDEATGAVVVKPNFVQRSVLTGTALAEEPFNEAAFKVPQIPLIGGYRPLTSAATVAFSIGTFVGPTGLHTEKMSDVYGGGKAHRDVYRNLEHQRRMDAYSILPVAYREAAGGGYVHSWFFNKELQDQFQDYVDYSSRDVDEVTFAMLEQYIKEFLYSKQIQAKYKDIVASYNEEFNDNLVDDFFSKYEGAEDIFGKGYAVTLTGRFDNMPFIIGPARDMDFFFQENYSDIYSGTVGQDTGFTNRLSVNYKGVSPGFMDNFTFMAENFGFNYRGGPVSQNFTKTGMAISYIIPFEEMIIGPLGGATAGAIFGGPVGAVVGGIAASAVLPSVRNAFKLYRAPHLSRQQKNRLAASAAAETPIPFVPSIFNTYFSNLAKESLEKQAIGPDINVNNIDPKVHTKVDVMDTEQIIEQDPEMAEVFTDMDETPQKEVVSNESYSWAATFMNDVEVIDNAIDAVKRQGFDTNTIKALSEIAGAVAGSAAAYGLGAILAGGPGGYLFALTKNSAAMRLVRQFGYSIAGFSLTKLDDPKNPLNSFFRTALITPYYLQKKSSFEHYRANILYKKINGYMRNGSVDGGQDPIAEMQNTAQDNKNFESYTLLKDVFNRVGLDHREAMLHVQEMALHNGTTVMETVHAMVKTTDKFIADMKKSGGNIDTFLRNNRESVSRTLIGKDLKTTQSPQYKSLLKQLNSLKEKGILTEEDFQIQKAFHRGVAILKENPQKYLKTVVQNLNDSIDPIYLIKEFDENNKPIVYKKEDLFDEIKNKSNFDQDAFYKFIGLYEYLLNTKDELTLKEVKSKIFNVHEEKRNSFDNYPSNEVVKSDKFNPPSEGMSDFTRMRFNWKQPADVYYKIVDNTLIIGEVHLLREITTGDKKTDVIVRTEVVRSLIYQKSKEFITEVKWDTDQIFYQLKKKPTKKIKDKFNKLIHNYFNSFEKTRKQIAKKGTDQDIAVGSRKIAADILISSNRQQGIYKPREIKFKGPQSTVETTTHPDFIDKTFFVGKNPEELIESIIGKNGDKNQIKRRTNEKRILENYNLSAMKNTLVELDDFSDFELFVEEYKYLFGDNQKDRKNYLSIAKKEAEKNGLKSVLESLIDNLNDQKYNRIRDYEKKIFGLQKSMEKKIRLASKLNIKLPKGITKVETEVETKTIGQTTVQEGLADGEYILTYDKNAVQIKRAIGTKDSIGYGGNQNHTINFIYCLSPELTSPELLNLNEKAKPVAEKALQKQKQNKPYISDRMRILGDAYLKLGQASKDAKPAIQKRIQKIHNSLSENTVLVPELEKTNHPVRQIIRDLIGQQLDESRYKKESFAHVRSNVVYGSILRQELKASNISYTELIIKDEAGVEFSVLQIDTEDKAQINRIGFSKQDPNNPVETSMLSGYSPKEIENVKTIGNQSKLKKDETLPTRIQVREKASDFIADNVDLLMRMMSDAEYDQLMEYLPTELVNDMNVLTEEGRLLLSYFHDMYRKNPSYLQDADFFNLMQTIDSNMTQTIGYPLVKDEMDSKTGPMTTGAKSVMRSFNPMLMLMNIAENDINAAKKIQTNLMEAAKRLEGPVARGIEDIQAMSKDPNLDLRRIVYNTPLYTEMTGLRKTEERPKTRRLSKLRKEKGQRRMLNDELYYDLRPSLFDGINDPTKLIPERTRAIRDKAKRVIENSNLEATPERIEMLIRSNKIKVTPLEIDEAFLNLKSEGKNVDIQDLIARIFAYVEFRKAQGNREVEVVVLTNRTIIPKDDAPIYLDAAQRGIEDIFGNNVRDLEWEYPDIETMDTFNDVEGTVQPFVKIDDRKTKLRLKHFVRRLKTTPGRVAISERLKKDIERSRLEEGNPITIRETDILDIRDGLIDMSVPMGSRRNKSVEQGNRHFTYQILSTLFNTVRLPSVVAGLDKILDSIFEKYTPSLKGTGYELIMETDVMSSVFEDLTREMRGVKELLKLSIDVMQKKRSADLTKQAELLQDNDVSTPKLDFMKPHIVTLMQHLRQDFIHPPVNLMHVHALDKLMQKFNSSSQTVSDAEIELNDVKRNRNQVSKLLDTKFAYLSELDNVDKVELDKAVNTLREFINSNNPNANEKVKQARAFIDREYATNSLKNIFNVDELEKMIPLIENIIVDPRMEIGDAISEVKESIIKFRKNDNMFSNEERVVFKTNVVEIFDELERLQQMVKKTGEIVLISLAGNKEYIKSDTSYTTAYTLFHLGRIVPLSIQKRHKGLKYDSKSPPDGTEWNRKHVEALMRQYGLGKKSAIAKKLKKAETKEDFLELANEIVNYDGHDQMYLSNLVITEEDITLLPDPSQLNPYVPLLAEMYVRLVAESKLSEVVRKLIERSKYGDLRKVSREKLIEAGMFSKSNRDLVETKVIERIKEYLTKGGLEEYGTYKSKSTLDVIADQIAFETIDLFEILPGMLDKDLSVEKFTTFDGLQIILPKAVNDFIVGIPDRVAPIGQALISQKSRMRDYFDRRSYSNDINARLLLVQELIDDVAEDIAKAINPKYDKLELVEKKKLLKEADSIVQNYLLQMDPDVLKVNKNINVDEIIEKIEKQKKSKLQELLDINVFKSLFEQFPTIGSKRRTQILAILNESELAEAIHYRGRYNLDYKIKDKVDEEEMSAVEQGSKFIDENFNVKDKFFQDALKVAIVRPIADIVKSIVTPKRYWESLKRTFSALNRITKQEVTTSFIAPALGYFINNFVGAVQQIMVQVGQQGVSGFVGTAVRHFPTYFYVNRYLYEGEFFGKKFTGEQRIPFTQPNYNPVIVSNDGTIYTPKTIALLAQKHGIGASFISTELARELESIFRDSDKTLLHKTVGRYISGRMFVDFAQGMDNLFRTAAFIDELEKGTSPSEAARIVRDTFFDYQDLTPFERDTLREFFLFYSYTRKNQIQVFRALAKNPSRVMAQLRMIRNSQKDALEERDIHSLPEYLQLRYILGSEDPRFSKRLLEYQIKDNFDRLYTVAPMMGVADATTIATMPFEIAEGLYAGYNLLVDDSGESYPLSAIVQSLSPSIETLGGLMTPVPRLAIESLKGKKFFLNQDLDKMRVPQDFVESSLFGMFFSTPDNPGNGINVTLQIPEGVNVTKNDILYYRVDSRADGAVLNVLLDVIKPASRGVAGHYVGRNRKLYRDLLYKVLESKLSGEPFTIPEGYSPDLYALSLMGFNTYLLPDATQEMMRRQKEKTNQE